jgi:hypothetical protein
LERNGLAGSWRKAPAGALYLLLSGRKAPAGTVSLVGELAGSLEETLDMEDLRSVVGMWTLERKEWDVASGGVKGVVFGVAFLTGVLRER